MKKYRKQYLIITFFALSIVIIFTGFNHLYGSNVDWISQHSVIPDVFRKSFYETFRLVPNFLFNLGAGQNIYNFSYYGLLSPIILISYLVPFVSMTTYVQIASVVLYILFGILVFRFILKKLSNEKLALVMAIFSLLISSVVFNFHHHIMFVWYLPFLVLALFGVDRYIDKRKSGLLIVSCFLIIMTNYYYSVGSLIVIYVYGIYCLLNRDDFSVRKFLISAIMLGVRLLIAVLMAMVILLPTLSAIGSMGGRKHQSIGLIDLAVVNFFEVFYKPGGVGLVGMFLVAVISNIFSKNKKRSEVFLNVVLLLLLACPIFMYVLNGLLYVRGKVLIPFIPLFLFAFGMFLKNLFKGNVSFIRVGIFLGSIIIITGLFRYTNFIFGIEITLAFIVSYFSFKHFNKRMVVVYTFVTLFVGAVVTNFSENYIDRDYYKMINDSNISYLHEKVENNDNGFFRSYNKLSSKDDANKIYASNYYSPIMYSSTYNSKYWDFYHFKMGNNIKSRNVFMQAGTDNELFYTYMGVKYMTSVDKNFNYYKKIDSKGNIGLYYNDKAYPICYVAESIGSEEELDNLEFPYSLEYLMKKAVVPEKKNNPVKSSLIRYRSNNLNKSYEFSYSKNKTFHYSLPEFLKGKMLFISFDMKYNQTCLLGDTYITINNIRNKLTCRDGIYHNHNNRFQYVIPIHEDSLELDVKISKGKYVIDNVEVYYSDLIYAQNRELNNLEVDKKNSIVTGNISLDKDDYLVTTIPYEKGFKVFVNDKEVDTFVVNKAFLGAKLTKGDNEIRIEYRAPFYDISVLISLVGVGIFLINLLVEYFFRRKEKKNFS